MFETKKTPFFMRRSVPVVLLAAMASFAACTKDKDFKKATVIDSGDVSSSGCGYILRMEDGSNQKPANLPSAYTHDGMKVKVKYHNDSGIVACHAIDTSIHMLQVIAIDDIKRDLD